MFVSTENLRGFAVVEYLEVLRRESDNVRTEPQSVDSKSMSQHDLCSLLFRLEVVDCALAKVEVELSRTLAQLTRDAQRVNRLSDLARETRSIALAIHKRKRSCSCPAWLEGAA